MIECRLLKFQQAKIAESIVHRAAAFSQNLKLEDIMQQMGDGNKWLELDVQPVEGRNGW